MSWPAKLPHLLRAQAREGGSPLRVMPAELVVQTGAALRARVLELATDPAFADWVLSEAAYVCSLVDRIVSAPIDPAEGIAEPYALRVIQDFPGLLVPVGHLVMKGAQPRLAAALIRNVFVSDD
jgi:tagaturonate reductase